jgi:hypothetical protein
MRPTASTSRVAVTLAPPPLLRLSLLTSERVSTPTPRVSDKESEYYTTDIP